MPMKMSLAEDAHHQLGAVPVAHKDSKLLKDEWLMAIRLYPLF